MKAEVIVSHFIRRRGKSIYFVGCINSLGCNHFIIGYHYTLSMLKGWGVEIVNPRSLGETKYQEE